MRRFAVLALLAGLTGAHAAPLAIVGGTVVDPAKGERPATVLIDHGKIAAAGEVKVPRVAKVIGAKGKYVVPGLWDMHAHLAATAPIGTAPEHYVAYGVLGVRDMGGFLDQLTKLRRDIAAGKRVGPDIYMAGPTLNGPPQPAPFHRVVATEAEARQAVDELKKAGVDFIKIHRQTTREAFFAIADETKKRGLTFAGHVPLTMSWIEGSDGGMHTIEHIQTIFENEENDPKKLMAEFPALVTKLEGPYGDNIWATLKKNGTYFDPTLVGYRVLIDKDGPEIAAKRRAAFEAMKGVFRRAIANDVKLLAGTDVLERHGEMLLDELDLLVEAGLTPRQALAAATTTACEAMARVCGIEAGAPASLLIVDGDPFADQKNLRKLSTVVLRGRVLDAKTLEQLRGMKP